MTPQACHTSIDAVLGKELPPEHWQFANVQSLLGTALLVQGRALLASEPAEALAKLAQARPLLVEGYEKLSPPASSATRKTEALQSVIELFEVLTTAQPGQGHDAESAKWKALLAAGATTQPAGS